MSVFDDGQHGVWGMTYKYHERAIVFNERNLHRVWDVAYDGSYVNMNILDWFCFYCFVRNGLVALLEALCAMHACFDLYLRIKWAHAISDVWIIIRFSVVERLHNRSQHWYGYMCIYIYIYIYTRMCVCKFQQTSIHK